MPSGSISSLSACSVSKTDSVPTALSTAASSAFLSPHDAIKAAIANVVANKTILFFKLNTSHCKFLCQRALPFYYNTIYTYIAIVFYTFFHFAYSVIFPVLPFFIFVTLFLNLLSVYQPTNLYPAFVGFFSVMVLVVQV